MVKSSYVKRGRAALRRQRNLPMGGTVWGAKRRRIAAARGQSVVQRVNKLYRMIETKESLQNYASRNFSLQHNNIATLINPLVIGQGVGDEMAGTLSRIGDRVTVKGVMIKALFENALNRPKVFYRVLLVRASKGETFNTTTLFKGNSPVKMIDQVNTDRFTVVAQKTFTVSSSNTTAVTVNVDGSVATGNPAGIATKIFSMWVPGTKFGKGGNIQFEDSSSSQVKFFDYRLVCMAYDWYGSDGTSPTVGKINSLYSKVYFKDA